MIALREKGCSERWLRRSGKEGKKRWEGGDGICRACGLSRGAALKPHWGFIHSRALQISSFPKSNKRDHPWMVSFLGRGDGI